MQMTTTLQERIKDVAMSMGIGFRHHYSGRGMFGRKCIGVDGSPLACKQLLSQVASDLAELVFAHTSMDIERGAQTLESVQEQFGQLMTYSQDNMGYDIIMYWEDLQLEEDEQEEESDV
jgi:hypothetical protein